VAVTDTATADAVGVADGAPRARKRRRQRRARRAVHARVVLAVAAVGVAYHHSLRSLLGDLGGDDPLAHLGLVPLLAVALGVRQLRRHPINGNLPHRHADAMVGVAFLALAAVLAWPAAGWFGWSYGDWRLDLIGLPCFVAGVIALLFGSRVLGVLRGPVILLGLASSAPWLVVLGPVLDLTTRATARAVAAVADVLPLLTPTGVADTIAVHGPGTTGFLVVIGSACAGANAMVGALLLGGTITVCLAGPWRRRLAWLGAAVALAWLVNLLRIVGVLLVGAWWGEPVALGPVHDVAGVVGMTVATALALSLLPAVGLAPAPAVGAGWDRARHGFHRSVRRSGTAAAGTVVVAVAALAPFNAELWRLDRWFTAVNHDPVAGVDVGLAALDGWTAVHLEEVGWAPQWFGPEASWSRYALLGDVAGAGHTAVDVVRTRSLDALGEYGVVECYRFHGFEVRHPRPVAVAPGVTAEVVRWDDPTAGDRWVTVAWIWPVAEEEEEAYERTVLLARLDGGAPTADVETAEARLLELAGELAAGGAARQPGARQVAGGEPDA
jgi:exosortase/archaeosortase family protein